MSTVASRRRTNSDPQVNRAIPTAAVLEKLAEATPRRSKYYRKHPALEDAYKMTNQ